MFGNFVITLAIAAFATTVAVQTGALSNVPSYTEAVFSPRERSTANDRIPAPKRIYPQTASCHLAKRQIAVYISTVPLFDMTKHSHRRLTPVYRRAWHAEQAWYDHNCP